jgi:ABC-2 type transport system ATP-binding protein
VIITVDNLTHRYGERTALDSLSFQVAEGAIYGLLGPNGGGKSTLFRILSTMMAADSGRVTVAGLDVERQPDAVRRQLGVVFQTQSLDKKLTVDENMISQGHLYGLSGALLRGRAEEALKRLGLADRRGDIVDTLSGGLKRRVEIAKALLHQPKVLLMDEPSSGLDPGARRELADYITELRSTQGVTVLLTSHILDEAERCDRLLLLHQGRCVVEGTPAELKARVGGDVVLLEVADAAVIEPQLRSRFHAEPHMLNGSIRVETGDGHRFVADVMEAFPGAVRSVAWHKPTLEDVFLKETGVGID